MPRLKKVKETVETPIVNEKASTKALGRSKERAKKGPQKEITEMQQIDGKNYNKKGVRSIDELLGETNNQYNTHDVKQYEAQLNNMNISDLQRHAASVQIMPKEDRRLLIKLLIKQFQINNSASNNLARQIPTISKPISQETLDILAEGR